MTAPGFKKFVESNVQVIVATDTRKDVTLEVGAATETITVTDTAPLLKTESGEMSHTVDITKWISSPCSPYRAGTSWAPARWAKSGTPCRSSELLPGVTFCNDASLVVNGLPSNSEAIRIEGQDSTGNIWKVSAAAQPGRQRGCHPGGSVQTSNFAAEYGQVGGGYFNSP